MCCSFPKSGWTSLPRNSQRSGSHRFSAAPGASGDQRISDHRLLHQQRSDGARERGLALFRTTRAAPNLSIYYEPADVAPVAIERAELGLRPDAVVYWCCQSLPKYLPQFDEIFARIAAEVPGCQLTFIEFGGGRAVTELFRGRLARAFGAFGLDARDYCVFLPRLTSDRFAAAIGLCDVVLDSIGWSGCNSILECLVHNIPVVTLAGEMMRGRHTAGIMAMHF